MKRKLSLFIFSIVLVFSAGLFYAEAYDSGCYGGNLYSVTTGQYCGSYNQNTYYNYNNTGYVIGCDGYNQYSVVTGQPCFNQGYSQTTGYNFTRELYLGSRGEDVMLLQQLLQGKGYAISFIDGIFGSRTRSAVMSFQSGSGLPVTGYADMQTLQALSYGSSNQPQCSPYTPQYMCPINPVYSVPVVNQVSGPQSLQVNQDGTWTVLASDNFGGNLTYSVDWGDNQNFFPYYGAQTSYMVPQQSSTFTHRYMNSGTYTATFTVTNSMGQSAKTSITVTVGGYSSGNMYIYSITPTSGPVGTQVNVSGTGLSGSTITMSGYPIQVISNSDTNIVFTIPSNLNNCYSGYVCTMVYVPVNPGVHPILIKNNKGAVDSRNFTVTSSSTGSNANITYLSPNYGRVGSQVIIYGTNLQYGSYTVNFGGYTIPNIYSYNGTSLTFTVPYVAPIYCIQYPCNQNMSVSVTGPNGVVSNQLQYTLTQ